MRPLLGFASTLPTPTASATPSATTEITVTVYSVVPNVVIEPLVPVMAAVDVESIYSNVTEVEYRLLYDDGVAHDELIEMFYPPTPPGENTASGTRILTVNYAVTVITPRRLLETRMMVALVKT